MHIEQLETFSAARAITQMIPQQIGTCNIKAIKYLRPKVRTLHVHNLLGRLRLRPENTRLDHNVYGAVITSSMTSIRQATELLHVNEDYCADDK